MANNYDFRNLDPVTGTQPEPLSPEALQINGEYLDKVVPGFTTLSVSGRELLSRDITTQKIGDADGELFVTSTHPTRTISVTYQLTAANPAEFRLRYDLLSQKIDQPESRLIFADADDRYYTGTHVATSDIGEGQLNTVGTLEFECPDPFAYAVTSRTFTNNGADPTTVAIENRGNYPAKVSFTATMRGDNGFIAAALNNRAYQVGIPAQIDGIKSNKSQTLWKGDPQASPSTGEMNKVGFQTVPKEQTTTIKQGSMSLHPDPKLPKDPILWPDNWGTVSPGKPIENTITYKIPNDTISQDEGAKSFSWQVDKNFNTGSDNAKNRYAVGQICCTVHRKDGTALASMLIKDMSVGSADYWTEAHINDTLVVHKKPTQAEVTRKFYFSISKTNGRFVFVLPTGGYSFNMPDLAEERAYYLSISFLKWGTNDTPATYQVHNWNFREDFVDYFTDIPNYFKAGDIVTYNGEQFTTTINDVENNDMVDIGSQLLYANPGGNTVGLIWSDWVPAAETPAVTINVQERWL